MSLWYWNWNWKNKLISGIWGSQVPMTNGTYFPYSAFLDTRRACTLCPLVRWTQNTNLFTSLYSFGALFKEEVSRLWICTLQVAGDGGRKLSSKCLLPVLVFQQHWTCCCQGPNDWFCYLNMLLLLLQTVLSLSYCYNLSQLTSIISTEQVFEHKPLWSQKKGRPTSQQFLGYLLACRLPPPYNTAQVR